MTLEKLVSGGQTGVDRGALDAALEANFPAAGWCPADRAAEDGTVPARYPLMPLPAGGYPERTLRNVLDSDGTVIIAPAVLTRGTRLTLEFCRRHAKPHLVIDATQATQSTAATQIAKFVGERGIRVLNVAGPRASQWPQGHEFALRTIRDLLARNPAA